MDLQCESFVKKAQDKVDFLVLPFSFSYNQIVRNKKLNGRFFHEG
jgi:hypothetical protein